MIHATLSNLLLFAILVSLAFAAIGYVLIESVDASERRHAPIHRAINMRLDAIESRLDDFAEDIDEIDDELEEKFDDESGPFADLRLQGGRADHSHLVLDRLRTAVEGRLKLVPDDPLARAMADAFDTDDDRLGRLIVPAGDLAYDIEHPATIMTDARASQLLVECTAEPEDVPFFRLAPGTAIKCPDNLCSCQAAYAHGGDYVIQTTV